MINRDLKQLINQYCPQKTKIDSKDSISRDLNITAQDGINLIQAYSVLFDIDISNFDSEKYFPTNKLDKTKTAQNLTIEDLINGIKAGKLDDDIIGVIDNDPNMPLKFTIKNTILGIIFIIITSTILGLIALYL